MDNREVLWFLFGMLLALGIGCIIWIVQKTLRERRHKAPKIKVSYERAVNFRDKSSLIEIKDEQVLSHIEQVAPALFKAGRNLKKAAQADTLCRVKFSSGTSWDNLAKSKRTPGAFRGFAQKSDGTALAHVDLIRQGSKFAKATQFAGASYNIAALIVGQHYMNQIDGKLEGIQNNLNQIANFQNNQYKSSVMTLLEKLKVKTSFEDKILKSPDLRQAELNDLYRLEHDALELLNQANLTLTDYTKINHVKYEPYDKALTEANTWFIYQGGLLEILKQIAELKHTLYLGAISIEQCFALLPSYVKQTEEARLKLVEWHENTTKRLGIDAENAHRKRIGIERLWLPFAGENNYKTIDEKTAEMIRTQSNGLDTLHTDTMTSLFERDVEVIALDGRVYYLQSAPNEQH